MTFKILSPDEAKGCHCSFEQWDKNAKRMTTCRGQAIARTGDLFLCLDHVPDGLVRSAKARLIGLPQIEAKTGKRLAPYEFEFKEDFLAACKEAAARRTTPKTQELIHAGR